MIFVNFKTYGEKTGESVSSLLKIIEEVSSSIDIAVTPVVQLNDTVSGAWVQYLGSSPKELIEIGVKGVFLNHSDHKYKDWDELIKARTRCSEAGLKTLIFAKDISELKLVLELKPDLASYEPPELIASAETSVSAAKPEVISEAFILSQKAGIPLIVGAGIKSKEDVKKSLELGAVGVAVSSAVTKALDPKKVLLELVKGFR